LGPKKREGAANITAGGGCWGRDLKQKEIGRRWGSKLGVERGDRNKKRVGCATNQHSQGEGVGAKRYPGGTGGYRHVSKKGRLGKKLV